MTSAPSGLGEQITADGHPVGAICSPTRSEPRHPDVNATTDVVALTAGHALAVRPNGIGQRADPAGRSSWTRIETMT